MSDAVKFFEPYFDEYKKLAFDDSIYPVLIAFAELARKVKERGGKLIFAGNGASAATAGHAALDLTKQGGVRAVTFHDPIMMTALANDCGYDHWLEKALELHADPGDAVVLISVSGESPSVVNAARCARSRDLPVVGFTGRHWDNSLARLSDVSFWVRSHAYNRVEAIHSIWLSAAIDYVIGRAVYEVRGPTG